MISVIGNIKIDETNPNRVKFLQTCIRSYAFLQDYCEIILLLQSPTDSLVDIVEYELETTGCPWRLYHSGKDAEFHNLSYGKQYCKLIDKSQYDFVLNFMEDQFMVMDSLLRLISLLAKMKQDDIDVVKASFHQIELLSARTLRSIDCDPISKTVGISFLNDEKNFAEYQKHYGKRFYIGVNFLTTKNFAFHFWNRDQGSRPHEYEIGGFSNYWKHHCMIPGPGFELQAPIDDDHGEPGTCLLKRNETKFWNLYSTKEVLT